MHCSSLMTFAGNASSKPGGDSRWGRAQRAEFAGGEVLSEDDIAERAPAQARDLQVTKTRRFHARKIDAVQWGATFIPVPVGERWRRPSFCRGGWRRNS